MIYPALFIDRPNRFIANIEIDGKREICHVKNTGRCRELLVPGATVYVQKSDNPLRKTKYDLISVQSGNRFVNVDSQAPNKVFAQWAQQSGYFGNITYMKPESKFGNSRFDFYLEANSRKIYIEVKGVTLENDGVALFPDAPTERGVKHLNELCQCVADGYDAYVFFIIKMTGCKYFSPNSTTHPEFAKALVNARNRGVCIKALYCTVLPDELTARDFVETRF